MLLCERLLLTKVAHVCFVVPPLFQPSPPIRLPSTLWPRSRLTLFGILQFQPNNKLPFVSNSKLSTPNLELSTRNSKTCYSISKLPTKKKNHISTRNYPLLTRDLEKFRPGASIRERSVMLGWWAVRVWVEGKGGEDETLHAWERTRSRTKDEENHGEAWWRRIELLGRGICAYHEWASYVLDDLVGSC